MIQHIIFYTLKLIYICTPIVDRKNLPEDVSTAPTLKLFQSLLVVTSFMALI